MYGIRPVSRAYVTNERGLFGGAGGARDRVARERKRGSRSIHGPGHAASSVNVVARAERRFPGGRPDAVEQFAYAPGSFEASHDSFGEGPVPP